MGSGTFVDIATRDVREIGEVGPCGACGTCAGELKLFGLVVPSARVHLDDTCTTQDLKWLALYSLFCHCFRTEFLCLIEHSMLLLGHAIVKPQQDD